jgi:hypothetical protein
VPVSLNILLICSVSCPKYANVILCFVLGGFLVCDVVCYNVFLFQYVNLTDSR